MFFWSDKGTSITEVKVEVDSAPQAPDAVHISESSESPQHLAFESTDPAESTAAVGNPSDPQSLCKHAVSRIPHSSSEVDACPVCGEQPVSQSSPSPLSHHSPLPQTRDGTTPAVAPNAATSIFALNFPMLGRSRPPPEIAVALPPRDPSSVGSSYESPVVTPGRVPVMLQQIFHFITARWIDPGDALNAASVSVTEPSRTSSTSTVHVSDCGDQPLSQPTAATEVHTNTWWTYLGWNASSSVVQSDPSAQNRTQSQSMDGYISPAASGSEQPPTSDPTQRSQPYLSSAIPAPTQPEGEMEAQVDGPDAIAKCSSPTTSVQDADAERVPQGPAWYTPWTWYHSSSPATTNAVATDMNSGSQQDPPQLFSTGSKTEENRSAGDHEAQQVSPAPLDPSAAPPVDYSNPVQSVISANPTGWLSFFTARAIAMKSLTYEKDDGKMEVMEIDDEVAAELNSVSSSTPTVTQPLPTQVTRPFIRAQTRTDIPSPSSPPPKRSSDKQSPIPHAVFKPETVANDLLKRQPSPSPSKKSGVKTPTSPPPPNLVLPTWNDLFHTLPRSAVPREAPSVLSKTLQYVSGVLFSRDETSLDKGKGKTKEIACAPYDKALPRTWDVLGRGDTMDVLRGCKRVVVIGVHGWFPGRSLPWICNNLSLTTTA